MTEIHEGKHPSEAEYIKIAAILALITAGEVGVYYISSLRRLLVPILVTMAIVKFTMVAMWFMHLKFDNRLFRNFFLLGLVLALVVFAIALATFSVVIPDAPA